MSAVVPGAVVLSGVVHKQPHGMFASVRGKQLRFMELKMRDDLAPMLIYYDHPKSDASVPKGLLYLDLSFQGFSITSFKERKEIEICSSLEAQTPEVAAAMRAGADVHIANVHVANDLSITFESCSEMDAWAEALNRALLTHIDSENIALTCPTLTLTQVLSPSAPAPPEGHIHFEEGFNLCAASHFKDAAACFDKAVALKHQLSHAMLSDILLFGRTGVPKNSQRSHKLALAGADMGCVHCKGLLAIHMVAFSEEPDPTHAAKAFELASTSARANSVFGLYACSYFYKQGIIAPAKLRVAIRFLKLAAAQGYAEALSDLGQHYRHGAGVREDKVEAMRMLRLASDQGHAQAQDELADMFYSGDGVGINKMEAARYCRLAADHAVAQARLALMLDTGDGVVQDKEQALRLYRLAADQNNAEAEFVLGMKFLRGEVKKEDGQFLSQEEKAVRLISSAALHGHAAAQYQYAMWLLDDKLPDGSVVDRSDYLELMTYAADQGLAQAQSKVAKYYLDNDDENRAFEYCKLAAQQGNADGQFYLGHFTLHGRCCVEDQAGAVELWRLAAEQGHAEAQSDLSNLFYEGREGVAQDYAEAAKYARMGADQGHAKSLQSLATMYLKGHGVARDMTESLRLMRLAADQGSEAAQLSVGKMYHRGVGADANFVEAARYCRLAMDQGNSQAHYLHAVLTMNDGVEPADQEQKNRLLIRGSEHGHPKVQLGVAKMLCSGDGVAVDKVEAARICRLAIAQGDAAAMTFMARMLADGEHGDRDKVEAVALLKRAWEEDAEAALVLGRMYYCGDGVDKDVTSACLMFVHAVEKGLKSEVDAALRSAGHQGSFEDFKARVLPAMPGVAWSK